jgi:ABC-type transporter Mla subunit MlaD
MLPFSTALPEIYRLVRDLTTQRTDLDKKILKAHDALQDTSTLLAELEQGLKDRAEKLEKIRAEYDSPMAHLFGPWEGLPPEVQGNYKNTVAFFNAQWGA